MQGIFLVDDKTECKVILVQFFLFGICLLQKLSCKSFFPVRGFLDVTALSHSYTELFEFLTHNFLSIIFICHGTVPIYVFLYFPSHQLLI